MAYPGDGVVVLCCFFVHFAFNADFSIIQVATPLQTAFVYILHGLTLLFYPVLGLVADFKCNRYNFVKVSIILSFISTLLMVLFVTTHIALSVVNISLVDPGQTRQTVHNLCLPSHHAIIKFVYITQFDIKHSLTQASFLKLF